MWLTLDQISRLYGRDRTVITRHINNIFNSEELYKECIDLINTLKFHEQSDIFAIERDKGLESIL